MFVSRLIKRKRPQDTIEAVSELSEVQNVKLYIVGNGPMRRNLELMAPDDVEFLGHIPYQEMPGIYRAADALVLPSRAEGLPRTVLEAMASGVGVVVSNLEQITSVIDDSGVTVPVGDVAGFSEGLETVLYDRVADPRAQIERQFDWRRTVEETAKAIKQL